MLEEGFPVAANYSWDQFALRCILNGRFPLWNPYQSCGNTFLANYLPALLFPPRWIVFFSEGAVIRDFYILLRFWVGGVSLYFLARRLGLSIHASAMALISFLGAGYFTRYYNENYLNIDLMLGLWLLSAESLIKKRTLSSALLFSLTVSAILLGGHPESAFHILLFISLWILYRAFSIYRFSADSFLTVIYCAGSGIIGFLIAGAQLLPFLEAFSQSANYHIPNLGRYHYELRHLATLSFPWLYGNFSTYLQIKTLPEITESLSYPSTTINWLPPYLGFLPLLFTTLGIIKIDKLPPDAKFFAIYFIGALGGVFGIIPFDRIFSVPPLYLVGNYKHIFPEITLACSLLAGMSFDLLVLSPKTTNSLFAIGTAFLIEGGYGIMKSAQNEFSYLILWGIIPLFVVMASLLLKLSAERKSIAILIVTYSTIFGYTSGYNPRHQGYLLALKHAPFVKYLQSVVKDDRFVSLFPPLLPTFGPWLGISDVRGHDALHGREFWRILNEVNSLSVSESAEFFYSSGGFGPLPESLGDPRLENLRLKYIVSPADLGGMIAVSTIARKAGVLAETPSSFKWDVWDKDGDKQPVLFVHPPIKLDYAFSIGEESDNLDMSFGWSTRDNLESSDGAFVIMKDLSNENNKVSYARHIANWEKNWIKSQLKIFPSRGVKRELIILPMSDKYHDWLGMGIKKKRGSFWGFYPVFPLVPAESSIVPAHLYLWNDILVYEKSFLPPLFSLAFDEQNLKGGNSFPAKQIAPDEYLFLSNPDKPILVARGFGYRPGWRLFCNGEIKIEPLADFSFYAKLGEGGSESCELRLRYIPFGFRISLWVTLSSSLCLIGLFSKKAKSLFTSIG